MRLVLPHGSPPPSSLLLLLLYLSSAIAIAIAFLDSLLFSSLRNLLFCVRDYFFGNFHYTVISTLIELAAEDCSRKDNGREERRRRRENLVKHFTYFWDSTVSTLRYVKRYTRSNRASDIFSFSLARARVFFSLFVLFVWNSRHSQTL